jgi:hypothetical protein
MPQPNRPDPSPLPPIARRRCPSCGLHLFLSHVEPARKNLAQSISAWAFAKEKRLACRHWMIEDSNRSISSQLNSRNVRLMRAEKMLSGSKIVPR